MSQVSDGDWKSRRRASIESLFDPGTITHLQALGVGAGWRCLDLSAGDGGITRWLCARTGRGGRVVATDLEGAGGELASAHWCQFESVFDEIAEASLDLVRARSTLARVSDRPVVIKKMVSCLQPGGWLLAEETDWISATPVAGVARASFERLYRAVLRYWASGGYDPQYGRQLVDDLTAAGLVDVSSAGRVFLLRGGTPEVEWLRLSLQHRRRPLTEPGSLSARQLERALDLLDDPEFTLLSPMMMAAWGRRPSSGSVGG